jgi:hypothetical protein
LPSAPAWLFRVEIAEKAFKSGDKDFPAGS